MKSLSPDFESIKRSSPYVAEYWRARDLGPLLGYTKWLLEKYCTLTGIRFQFQQKLGDSVFDCLIGNYIAVEFDEPHHMDRRGRWRDARKEAYARSLGLKVVRFDLNDDIVDMIVEIERQFSVYDMAAYDTSLTA